jgi:uncharacterized HAD superfamily protein
MGTRGSKRFLTGHLAKTGALRIAVDLDGVLADTMVTVCEILNKRLSKNFTPESFVRWRAWETAGITREEFFNALDEAWFSWQAIPPTEENLGATIKKLTEWGVVDIVTGRSPATVPQANSWLEEHKIFYNSFVRTDNSTIAKLTLNYNVYVDDSAELMSLLAAEPQGFGVLYLRPWNRSSARMSRVFRAEKWGQIPGIVEQVSAGKIT